MPRSARVIVPGIPLHIVARGNNKQACFFSAQDHTTYLNWLQQFSRHHSVAIHAYVLMSNHVHLLASCPHPTGYAAMMKALSQHYTQYINRRYQRTGTLWEGRYKSQPVHQDIYLLNCHHYIEQNPVRAKIVQQPAQYPWSSYHTNALGKNDGICTPHSVYLALGTNETQRLNAYKAMYGDRPRNT